MGAMTIAECAAELRCSEDKILDLINAGFLHALKIPETKPRKGNTGPKGYRVDASDWKDFYARIRFTVAEQLADQPEQTATTRPAQICAAKVTGPDGIQRRPFP